MNVLNYNVKFEWNGKTYFKQIRQVRGKEEAIEAIQKNHPGAKILKTYVSQNARGEII